MVAMSKNKNYEIFVGIGTVLLVIVFGLKDVHANNLTNLFKERGLQFGGWINGGITYNANNPSDGFNGTVTFADRANQPQLNQLNLFLQRPVRSEGTEWDM